MVRSNFAVANIPVEGQGSHEKGSLDIVADADALVEGFGDSFVGVASAGDFAAVGAGATGAGDFAAVDAVVVDAGAYGVEVNARVANAGATDAGAAGAADGVFEGAVFVDVATVAAVAVAADSYYTVPVMA